MTERMQLGQDAEDLVARELARLGYSLVVRNFRERWGELDLVVRNATEMVIVEVRSRCCDDPDDPADSLSPAKRAKVRLTAQRFLDERPIDYREVRIHAALVTWEAAGPRITLIEDAF